ncbi:MAG: hypothetical protein IPL86_11885 [Flavobacteriales bacterium]|nr:hypothetical protein [Flavobacteriales bacterium]
MFDYGYLGKFISTRIPTYDFLTGKQTGFQVVNVDFVPGDLNPTASAFDEQYFNLFPTDAGFYTDFNAVFCRQWSAERSSSDSVYSLWSNVGSLSNRYSTYQQGSVHIGANGSADIGKHAVSIGVDYEQLTQRSYRINPLGLWGRARDLADFHLQQLDFSDSTLSPGPDGIIYTSYDRLVRASRTTFDYNLRTALGLDPNGTDYIDVDALDPSTFSLDMFAPDELIQSGQGLINPNNTAVGLIDSYYGYDYLDNKLTSRPTFERFLRQEQQIGQ